MTSPSSTSAELGLTSPTKLDYTGMTHLANGTPAQLAAMLTDFHRDALPGRSMRFVLGTGEDQQSCTGTTGDTGTATCTVASVDQPLTDSATVPLRASFAGDAGYLASETSAQLKLQYATGRAYGLSAHVALIGVPLLEIEPQPDTGTVRTADASATDTPCSAEYSSPLLSVQKLCPKVTTTLAPGKVTATSTVAQARIGLPGVPVIEVSGLTAVSSSECGRTTGSTTLTLKIAGVPVTVSGDPNTEIPLVGGGRLIVNEQLPSTGADAGHGRRRALSAARWQLGIASLRGYLMRFGYSTLNCTKRIILEVTGMATAPRPDMAAHPDIIAMRERHEMAERTATTPRAQVIETTALITGLYLAASPWITGFNGLSTLAVNNLIVGIAYALIMSGGFGRAYDRVHSMAWAACVLSVWTIISPWAVAGDVSTTKTIVNNVIVGVIGLLLALTAASIGRPADRATSGRMSAPYAGGRS